MATLKGALGELKLPCRAVVGRSTLADVPLTNKRASSEHAWLGWSGGRWTVRDLGSSNGTKVNGRPLLTRDRATLATGSTVCFGGDEETWVLVDAAPPDPCAVRLGPQQYLWGQESLLLLPSTEEPEASIFVEGTTWRVDAGNAITGTECGDIVELPSGYYRLLLPDVAGSEGVLTAGHNLDLAQIELCFRVSPERLLLTVIQGTTQVPLPSRACLHTLLALARVRLGRSRMPSDDGWISTIELAEIRGCSPEKVNVDVHRLRKLFQESGVHQAAQIIERDDAKRLRIGIQQIKEQSA